MILKIGEVVNLVVQTAIGRDPEGVFNANRQLFIDSKIEDYFELETLCKNGDLLQNPIMNILKLSQ